MSESAPVKHLVIGVIIATVLGGVGVWQAVRFFDDAKAQGTKAAGTELDEPIRVPDFRFTNHLGEEVSRETLLGQIWVADFIFTQCSGTCPKMSERMSSLQEALASVRGFKLVSVSCDPKNDTLERLRDYAANHGAHDQVWWFLRGDAEAVKDFSVRCLKLGLRHASKEEIAKGAERIIHSRKFVLVDRKGDIRGYYDGTSEAEVDQLIKRAHAIAEER